MATTTKTTFDNEIEQFVVQPKPLSWDSPIRKSINNVLTTAVKQSDTDGIKKCWAAATKEVKTHGVERTLATRIPNAYSDWYLKPDHERLARNCQALIATSGLAAAAKNISNANISDCASRKDIETWIKNAVKTIASIDEKPKPNCSAKEDGDNLANTIDSIEEQFMENRVNFEGLNTGNSSAESVLRHSFETFFQKGAKADSSAIATWLFWSLYWLDSAREKLDSARENSFQEERSLPEAKHRLWVPIAAYNRRQEGDAEGVIAHLIIEEYDIKDLGIDGNRKGNGNKGPILIEHPDNALCPLDRVLLETIEKAWERAYCRNGGSKCSVVSWRLAIPKAYVDTPLSGNSLGGRFSIAKRRQAVRSLLPDYRTNRKLEYTRR